MLNNWLWFDTVLSEYRVSTIECRLYRVWTYGQSVLSSTLEPSSIDDYPVDYRYYVSVYRPSGSLLWESFVRADWWVVHFMQIGQLKAQDKQSSARVRVVGVTRTLVACTSCTTIRRSPGVTLLVSALGSKIVANQRGKHGQIRDFGESCWPFIFFF